jgi:hypothetical protein
VPFRKYACAYEVAVEVMTNKENKMQDALWTTRGRMIFDFM